MSLLETEAQLFQSFLTAFSYTLAITTVDRMVESGDHDLLILSAAVGLSIFLVRFAKDEIEGAERALKEANLAPHVESLIHGPVKLLVFLLQTATQVLVQFLSSSLGRWAIMLSGSSAVAIIPTVLIGTALIFLLGTSTGLMR